MDIVHNIVNNSFPLISAEKLIECRNIVSLMFMRQDCRRVSIEELIEKDFQMNAQFLLFNEKKLMLLREVIQELKEEINKLKKDNQVRNSQFHFNL